MPDDTRQTEASKHYAAAHVAHYATKDLNKALHLYREIIADHPNSPEAGYSHAQIQNIVKSVVPQLELLAAQMDLALPNIAQAGPA
jgi:hypothetical protein